MAVTKGERAVRLAKVTGVKYVVTEGYLILGGGHTMQHADHIS